MLEEAAPFETDKGDHCYINLLRQLHSQSAVPWVCGSRSMCVCFWVGNGDEKDICTTLSQHSRLQGKPWSCQLDVLL
jgi:hypothetical protein